MSSTMNAVILSPTQVPEEAMLNLVSSVLKIEPTAAAFMNVSLVMLQGGK